MKYIAFLCWLSFRAFKGGDTDNINESDEGCEPPKKRQCTTTNIGRGFKRDFDSPLSRLSDHLPLLMKSRPSRSMVADWWVKEHPEVKLVSGYVEWLIGFYNRLNDDELHPVDRNHLEELTNWHKTRENEHMGDTQPVAGPSH